MTHLPPQTARRGQGRSPGRLEARAGGARDEGGLPTSWRGLLHECRADWLAVGAGGRPRRRRVGAARAADEGVEGAVVFFGGRPRRGAGAATTASSLSTGFNRSIDTATSFNPICRVNTLSLRFITLYGPL